MRNRTYGGVRGRKTKVGRKLLRFPPTRLNSKIAQNGLLTQPPSISDAHNHRGPHDCPHHASIVVAAPCAGLASKNKRIICNACNNPPPNSRDARSSVRTNEQPNRIRSLTYVDKHNLLIIIRLYVACGRSNERPYGLVG